MSNPVDVRSAHERCGLIDAPPRAIGGLAVFPASPQTLACRPYKTAIQVLNDVADFSGVTGIQFPPAR
ncbi:MAG: hypothetical protein WD136_05745, partial [Cyanobium sp.]